MQTSLLGFYCFTCWCVISLQTQRCMFIACTSFIRLFQTCVVPVIQRVSAGLPPLCGLEEKRVATWGREHLVWDQSVVWVGGVRVAVGKWKLPQHMACNCGLVDSEKWGCVMVFGWSHWWALVEEREKTLSCPLIGSFFLLKLYLKEQELFRALWRNSKCKERTARKISLRQVELNSPCKVYFWMWFVCYTNEGCRWNSWYQIET